MNHFRNGHSDEKRLVISNITHTPFHVEKKHDLF